MIVPFPNALYHAAPILIRAQSICDDKMNLLIWKQKHNTIGLSMDFVQNIRSYVYQTANFAHLLRKINVVLFKYFATYWWYESEFVLF